MALLSMTNNIVIPVFRIFQFLVQLREMWDSGNDAKVLSRFSLRLLVIVSTAVSIRWTMRLGKPYQPRWGCSRGAPLWYRYVWGMFPINDFVQGIGYAGLLTACTYAS